MFDLNPSVKYFRFAFFDQEGNVVRIFENEVSDLFTKAGKPNAKMNKIMADIVTSQRMVMIFCLDENGNPMDNPLILNATVFSHSRIL